MSKQVVFGAQMTVLDIDRHRDWLFEHDRDIELAEFCMADILNNPDPFIEMAKKKLDGWRGRLGIHGPFSGFELHAKDPDIRAVAQKRLDQALDVCGRIGATQMVIHSPYDSWDAGNLDTQPKGRRNKETAILDTLRPALARAADLGVELVLENIKDVDPDHRADIISAAATPNLRSSIDVGHAFWAERTCKAPAVADWIRAAGQDLSHIHLQDADGLADRHWVPGEGTLPFQTVFKALAETGAEPRLIIEIKNYDRLPDGAAYLEAQGFGI